MNAPLRAKPFAEPALRAINHVLDQATWARQKLQPFAGRTISIVMPPFSPCFAITSDGRLEVGNTADKAADLHILLPANTPLLALQGSDKVIKAAQINGPADLADAFSFVLRNLRWDFEEDLSKAFGDITAHRMAIALKRFGGWQRQALHNLTGNVGEYFIEENPILVKPAEITGFADDVGQLSSRLSSLETRINHLQEKCR